MNKTMVGVPLAATLASLSARAGPTEITQCQTISASGPYVLANSVQGFGPGSCPAITGSFVTIDLAGFMIEEIHGTGIFAGPSSQGVRVRNGSINVSDGNAVNLSGEGSIVEGLYALGGGIVANGIVRNNIVGGDGFSGGIGATGIVTGNYVSGLLHDGIAVGPGSTVIGNTSINNGGAGISADCPANLVNTAVGNHPNIVLNGKGCLNKDNVAP